MVSCRAVLMGTSTISCTGCSKQLENFSGGTGTGKVGSWKHLLVSCRRESRYQIIEICIKLCNSLG